jgi:hypothetical protein
MKRTDTYRSKNVFRSVNPITPISIRKGKKKFFGRSGWIGRSVRNPSTRKDRTENKKKGRRERTREIIIKKRGEKRDRIRAKLLRPSGGKWNLRLRASLTGDGPGVGHPVMRFARLTPRLTGDVYSFLVTFIYFYLLTDFLFIYFSY